MGVKGLPGFHRILQGLWGFHRVRQGFRVLEF